MNARMTAHLRILGGGTEPSPQQIYNAFVNLTLEGCAHSCSHCLGTEGEMKGITPSRWLAYRSLDLELVDQTIAVDESEEWKSRLRDALGSAKRIKLRYPLLLASAVAAEVSMLLSKEHDRGYLFAPFVVTGASRRGVECEMSLQPTSDIQA